MLSRSHAAVLLTFLLVFSRHADGSVGPSATGGPGQETVPGVLIVKLKTAGTPGGGLQKVPPSLQALLSRVGVLRRVPAFPDVSSDPRIRSAEQAAGLDRIMVVSIPVSADPAAMALQIAASPDVEYAEPKYVHVLHDVPNDPQYTAQQAGYFARMQAPEGWSIARGAPAVIIAVVDGGTFWEHEDLLPALWVNPGEDLNRNGRFDRGPSGDENGVDDDGNGLIDDLVGWNFANNTNDPRGLAATPENAAHGTATASIAAAATNNSLGMAGAGWGCSLMPICASSTRDDLISFGYEGIRFAYTHGARVINCSWGRTGGFSRFEQDVIDAAALAGALVVASAGNDGINADLAPQYPATYRNVLGVGATNSVSDQRAPFSNYGLTIPVYAPGVSIWGAGTSGTASYQNVGSGTSFSAPLTSGLAGILAAQRPSWIPAQIAAQIRVTAENINTANPSLADSLGHGRINFVRALSETHPALQVEGRLVATPAGRVIFLPGDTIVVNVTVANVLADATGLQFVAASADPALIPLDVRATLPQLLSGQRAALPPFRFRVGAVSDARRASITLFWTAQATNRDGTAFGIALFPTMPSWVWQNSPSDITLASVDAVSPVVAWAAGSDSTPIVSQTRDGGLLWRDVTGNLANVQLYCVSAADSLFAWVGTGDGRIFATSDGGTTWYQQAYPGRQSSFMNALWFFDRANGFAMGDPPGGSDNRFIVLKTTDGGQTWAHLPGEPLGGSGEASWNNSFWWTDPLHGWFGSNSSHVWRTTDGGQTWVAYTTPAKNSVGVAFRDSLVGLAVFDNGMVAGSTDGGVTWTTAPQPAASLAAVAYPRGSQSAWVAAAERTFRTTDNGQHWMGEYIYPTIGSIRHLSFADSLSGWAVTSAGEILKYAGTPGGGPTPPAPVQFLLEQNSPNPFRDVTRIRVSVPSAGSISLHVYDLLGRRVRTLADGYFGPGEYPLVFEARGLASGIYFYRLLAPGFSATRKMILLR